MTITPLEWSAPFTEGYETVEAKDGKATWRIVDVRRDVVRISCSGYDKSGYFFRSDEMSLYGESVTEAKMIVEMLRNGSDHLPEWRDQLETAGFFRTHPNSDSYLSQLWHDERNSGRFTINVCDNADDDFGQNLNVHATYESGRSDICHNVSNISAPRSNPHKVDKVKTRHGLSKPVDTLKMGVAVALAIRAARMERGGPIARPLK